MTMKNKKKNISAENESIVQDISLTTSPTTSSSSTSNFNANQVFTITNKNFLDEEEVATTKTITIPIKDLVRLKYLQNNYYTKSNVYTKTEIDSKIKLHYKILESINDLPTASEVREAGKQNYIYLVPFVPDNELNNSEQQDQEGHYIEYIYTVDDDDDLFETERMERIGSTKLDLTPYLKISNLNSQLLQASNFTDLEDQVSINTTTISDFANGKVNIQQNVANGVVVTSPTKQIYVASTLDKGRIGGFSNSDEILITDNNNKITTIDELPTNKIVHNAILENINTGIGDSQSEINTQVDGIIGSIVDDISDIESNYELKSDLKSDVWGSNGFLTLQDAEESNSPNKNLKLGDYIYQHLYANFYTKSQINSLIGTLANLQQNTLEIL